MWREILISSFSWSNVSRAVHSYSWDVNFYLFSSTADPILTEASIPTTHGSSHGLVPQVQYSEHFSSPDIHTHHHSAPSTIFTPRESLSTDPYLISGPGPSTVTEDEPIDEVMMPDKSDGPNSYCCSWVWNSVKDYWERLYGSVVYSMTKLLIGMLLSIASPKSVRAQGRTFSLVVGRFWGLCSVFILIMNEGFRPVEIFDPTLCSQGTVEYRKIPKIRPSKYKPSNPVTQKTLR